MFIKGTTASIFLMGAITAIWISSPLVKASVPTCSGSYTGTTFDHIVVPAGETCRLDRFNVVDGNITVEEGATLMICPDNEINGNVEAHDAYSVFISDMPVFPCESAKALGVTIDGNVDIKGAEEFSLIGNPWGVTSISGNVMVKRTQNVHIENFAGIEGNVEAKNNGNVFIVGNTIDGNLIIHRTLGTCTGDETNNTVSGKTDPCS